MKALTLWQPWASLIALGEKQIETRCWETKYRGELAIHAAAKLPPLWLAASSRTDPFRDELADVFNVRRDRDDRCGSRLDAAIRKLPFGAVLCIVNLVDIEPASEMRETISNREYIFGNYEDGHYAWFFNLVEVFDQPIPAKGNRLLWNWQGWHE